MKIQQFSTVNHTVLRNIIKVIYNNTTTYFSFSAYLKNKILYKDK